MKILRKQTKVNKIKLECKRLVDFIELTVPKIVRIIEMTQTKEGNGGYLF